jgi:hypothetical protein
LQGSGQVPHFAVHYLKGNPPKRVSADVENLDPSPGMHAENAASRLAINYLEVM